MGTGTDQAPVLVDRSRQRAVGESRASHPEPGRGQSPGVRMEQRKGEAGQRSPFIPAPCDRAGSHAL